MNLLDLVLSRFSLDCKVDQSNRLGKIRSTCRMPHSSRVSRHLYTSCTCDAITSESGLALEEGPGAVEEWFTCRGFFW
jgi:hypothetical protein